MKSLIKLSLVFLISLLASTHSFANINEIPSLFLKLSVKPYDTQRLDEFTKAVSKNHSELKQTKQGREFISEANRFRKVNALKSKLDKCFGSDVLNFKSVRDILNAAISDPSISTDCKYLLPNTLSGDFSNFIEAFDKHNETVMKEVNRENNFKLAKNLFGDTLKKAAAAEAKLQYLLTDNSKVNGEYDLQVSSQICSADINCPKKLKDDAAKIAKAQIKSLEDADVPRESAREASTRMQEEVRSMFTSFYSEDNPYYYKNQNISNVPSGLIKNVDRMSPNVLDHVTNGISAKHLITYRYGDDFRKKKRDLMRKPNGKLIYQAELSALKKDLIASVPEEFYNKQNAIQQHPLARQLASNQEFGDSLGFGLKPEVSSIPGIGQSLLLLNENSSVDKSYQARIKQLSESSLKDEKKNQIERLRTNLRELGEDIYSKEEDEDGERASESLKKLLVSNPDAAAREVMKDPSQLNIYCDALKAIEADKERDKYISYALMGASIAAIPFAMVTGPLVGGAALAGIGAMDLAYAGSQYMSLKEMARLKEIACYGSSGDSQTCKEYEDTMDEAIFILGTAGLGLGISGGVKIVKLLPKLSKMKDTLRANPNILASLRNKHGHFLNSGDEIPEDFWDSLMDEMDSMKPKYESVVKEIDDAHFANASSGALRNITDDDILRMYRGRNLTPENMAKLKVQVRSRNRSNLGATEFAKAKGWDPDNADSFMIRSKDLEPGFMQPDRTVHPVSLRDNSTFGFKKGWVQVQVHGSGSGFSNHGNVYSAKELAEHIKSKGHTNQPIELSSCWAGKPKPGELTMAQQLSNELGVPVVAPTRTLELTLTPLITRSKGDFMAEGRWRVFYPES